jgi:O-antigen ligase
VRRRVTVSRGSLVVAAAIPLLFLHSEYQPSVSVQVGGTGVDAYLSDFAVLAVVLVAIAAIVRGESVALRPGVLLWSTTAAFFAWLVFELAWGRHEHASYPVATHAVTALKFLEYALLAPAAAVLLRRRRDLLVALWSFALWSCAATVVGIAEFFGADVGAKGTVGHRQASFLSSADFAALSAAVLLVGVIGLVVARARLPRPLVVVALTSGALGTIVAGAIASVLGIATALAVLAIVLLAQRERRLRSAVSAGVVALVVVAGVVAIRGSDLNAFARFVGASQTHEQTSEKKVQTYAHRTLLAWLGLEIWKDHPILGVGWEASAEPDTFEPYLPAAHRRFPDESPLAFPARPPERHYGVQNVWIQALADLGVIGLALWAAVFAVAAWLALRARLQLMGSLALAWIGLLVWLWSAQGFVAGLPLDALTFLAFGVAAARLVDE